MFANREQFNPERESGVCYVDPSRLDWIHKFREKSWPTTHPPHIFSDCLRVAEED